VLNMLKEDGLDRDVTLNAVAPDLTYSCTS
jgi:hypothetical protein